MPQAGLDAVFLNIPYDAGFRRLYLAYIVGLIHLGLEPRVTLGIPSGARRLDKILQLIKSCRYSVHDLSRVQLDRTPPCTPRFNMPFELGLAVAWAKQNGNHHQWYVFETVNHRAQKSISDLNGTDPNIHDGRVAGVMRELCNAFVRSRSKPTVPAMMRTYRVVARQIGPLQASVGAGDLYQARLFADLCIAARAAIDESTP